MGVWGDGTGSTRLTSAATILLLLTLAACAGSPGVDLPALDDELERLAATGEFSGAVLIAHAGQIVFSEGYGLANRETGRPVESNTVFPLGSIVKDYTQLVVLELVNEGRLSLQMRLSAVLPAVPPDKADITLLQLLRHEAGLHPHHDRESNDRPADLVEMSREEALGRILDQELLFPPGSESSYSNSGYTLLAIVAEEATGRPFIELLRTYVLEPAGADRTGAYGPDLWNSDEVAVGYGSRSWGAENSPYHWPHHPWPLVGNGGLAGPLRDLHSISLYVQERRRDPGLARHFAALRMPDDAPEGFYGSAGGGALGFVMVAFYIESTGDGLLFAQNNNPTGTEDPQLIMRMARLGLGFDPLTLLEGDGTEDQNDDVRLEAPK